MRILLVDDDEALMGTLANHLIHQRYAVDITTDGRSAQGYLDMFSYDLVVLDLNLPDGSGIDFCQAFRSDGYEQPILVLSATSNPAQKVRALDAGADDYVVKPFDLAELDARIRALLRREQVGLPTVLQLGGLNLDPSTCETSYNGQPVRLTPKEFALLELFLRRPSRVYSLDAIIDDLWPFENPPSEDAVRTHIKGLRQKLSAVGAPKNLIKTVYGLGYRLNVGSGAEAKPVVVPRPSGSLSPGSLSSMSSSAISNAASSTTPGTTSGATPSTTPGTASNTTVAVAQAWKKYQGVMQERVAVLEQAAIAIEQGTLDQELCHTSQTMAHKLVGALGSFGFPLGSTLAQRLEHLLKTLPAKDIPAVQFNQLVHQLRQQVDETSVEAATETVTAGAPLLLLIGSDDDLMERLSLEATQQSLRVRQANTLSHALELLPQIKPQLVMFDLPGTLWGPPPHEQPPSHGPPSSEQPPEQLPEQLPSQLPAQLPDQLLEDMATFTQRCTGPFLVLLPTLPAQARLQLVQQGASQLLKRSSPIPQLVADARRMMRTTPVKIIIVDDDPQILQVLQMSLGPWNFDITPLTEGQQLWAALETIEPDALVLDVTMPGITGFEICQLLRADPRWRTLPIIFLTVHEAETTRGRAFRFGADDFINKSVAASELAVRILNQIHHQPVRRPGRPPVVPPISPSISPPVS